MPRPRPPFPAVAGLWAKPSVLNNVETLANIGQIMLRGGEWYASVGTEKTKGTKVFALTGDVNNVGLVEVPMGTTLGTIIYDIGGGIPGGKKFKAAQLGGPSGGCIPVQHLNASVDYEKVAELGAIMGSGGLIVMNEDKCAVDMARFFMDFCQDESCGKCTPCREGTQRMLEILTNITKGKGKEGDIELLESMAAVIKDASLCGLGQTAPNPVLSTIRYFRNEYEEHIRDKKCRAGRLLGPLQVTLPAHLPDRDGHPVLHRADPGQPAGGRLQGDAADEPLPVGLRPGLRPQVPVQVPPRQDGRAGRDQVPEALHHRQRPAARDQGRSGHPQGEDRRGRRRARRPDGCARDLALRGYNVTVFEELPSRAACSAGASPPTACRGTSSPRRSTTSACSGVRSSARPGWARISPAASVKRSSTMSTSPPAPTRARRMGVEGEELKGVYGGVEFLRDYNTNEEGWTERQEEPRLEGGRHRRRQLRHRCGPHGQRLGADVTILYRRLREDMPAAAEEIVAAEHEGIKIEYLIAPLRIVGTGGTRHRDRVPAAETRRIRLERPQAARCHQGLRVHARRGYHHRRHRPDAGSVLRARGKRGDGQQMVLLRCGQDDIESQTTNPKFFAGGDAVTGPSTVIKAIAAGHEAADDIDASIRVKNGEPAWVPPSEEKIHIPFVIDEETEECPQAHMPELEADFRRKNFIEVELGYNKDLAIKESARCLRCDAEI